MKYSVNITVEFDTMVEMDQVSHAAVEIMRQRGGRVIHYSRNAYADQERTYGQLEISPPARENSDEANKPEGSGEAPAAVADKAAPRTRKPRAQKSADVAAPPASATADAPVAPNADDVSGPTQPPQQGGGESVASAGDTEDEADAVDATWTDFVAVMNKVSGKGIDVARKLLSDHGVARAIDLKDDSKAAMRGKIVAAAQKVLA